jgi:hypothetical protein
VNNVVTVLMIICVERVTVDGISHRVVVQHHVEVTTRGMQRDLMRPAHDCDESKHPGRLGSPESEQKDRDAPL